MIIKESERISRTCSGGLGGNVILGTNCEQSGVCLLTGI